jgi:hypothetical protein
MAEDPLIPRKKTLGELKSAAIARLERRGYDIRGKTPAQIRQLLKRRPTKPTPPLIQVANSQDAQLISRKVTD